MFNSCPKHVGFGWFGLRKQFNKAVDMIRLVMQCEIVSIKEIKALQEQVAALNERLTNIEIDQAVDAMLDEMVEAWDEMMEDLMEDETQETEDETAEPERTED